MFDVIAQQISNQSLALLVAANIQCTVPEAPRIYITPRTDPIVYDYSKTSAELGVHQSDTINPYGANVDTSTGGLREDKPQLKMEVFWKMREYQGGEVCLWYDEVKVDIHLQPKIYIAKEFNKGRCRDAIMTHELKHVQVDRDVMNKYAQLIGQSVQQAVNSMGAVGPYNKHRLDSVQQSMASHIRNAVMQYQLPLQEEMRRRQSQVDSLEEYTAVSKICDPYIRR